MSYILSGSASGPFKFGTYVPADGDILNAMSVRTAFSDAWDNMSYQDLRTSRMSGSVYVISNNVNYLMSTVPALSSSVQKIDSNFPYAHDTSYVLDISLLKSVNNDTSSWQFHGGYPASSAAYWLSTNSSADDATLQMDLPIAHFAVPQYCYIKSITVYVTGDTSHIILPGTMPSIVLQVVSAAGMVLNTYRAIDTTSDVPTYHTLHAITLDVNSTGTPFPNNILIGSLGRATVSIQNDSIGLMKIHGITYTLSGVP